MKKVLSIIFSFVLMFSLCACGNADTNDTEDTSTSAEPTEITTETTTETESEEEKALKAIKSRYEKANEYLAEYLENGYFRDDDWKYYEDAAALEYLYKEFEALGDYEDCAEILSRFTVLPDMLTSITNTKIDNLGNVAENCPYNDYYIDEFGRISYYDSKYSYDERGSLTEYNNPIIKFLGIAHYRYEYEYEYDEVGNITKAKAIRWGAVEIIAMPEYDANGNIVKATIQTNEDTYTNTYTYDIQNRLIAAEKATMDSYGIFFCPTSYTYRYDANGNLTEESYVYTDDDNREYPYQITHFYDEKGNRTETSYSGQTKWWKDYEGKITYVYDANGYLVEKKETFTEDLGTSDEDQTIFQFLYTNDENGRPVSAELIETVDGKNSYDSQILTYNYETLYFYDAE